MKILYIGDDQPGSTSLHRAEELRRLGHQVAIVNPRRSIPPRRWAISLAVRTGFRVWMPLISRDIKQAAAVFDYEVAWVDCGGEVTPGMLHWLKRRGQRVINYNHDDPFGPRDGRKWDQYRKCVPDYDMLGVVRGENVAEALAMGAHKVARVYRACDPIAHAPLDLTQAERNEWATEVVFVGNWFPERGPFMARLVELGVPLTIRGEDWQRAPELSQFQQAWTGRAANGRDYVRVIQSAKVALGLLSRGNRDLHTTRSAEVPYIGGAVFCAERTSEHEMLYRDGEEAVFWSSPEECAARCRELLADEERRRRIAEAARLRVLAWRLTNDEIMAALLRVLAGEPAGHPLVQVAGCNSPRQVIADRTPPLS
jgi:hypothetical protein